MSYLEGVFSRGDRRLSRVIERAWRKGARFDGWDDRLEMAAWTEAFAEEGLDPDWYALRGRALEEILPWVAVGDTVSDAFLKRELRRAGEERVTDSCADLDPSADAQCFVCDACARSPHWDKKLAMLAARDWKYARRTWALKPGASGAGAE